tara:strand:+ start:212 stop:2710 length:2499 start_codon:yes stop_codon:yes gene_type:complete
MVISKIYNQYILKNSKVSLLILASIIIFFAFQIKDLVIDASTDTLILEGDKDLAYTQLVNKRYYSPDFLILAYTPNKSLFSDETLKNIENITSELLKLSEVESITSILNVPLLQSPPRPIAKLLEHIPTMSDKNIDLDLVKKEFLESPIYKDNLVSKDFSTTALIINLKDNIEGKKLSEERRDLRTKKRNNLITEDEQERLYFVEKKYDSYRKNFIIRNEIIIKQIRNIISPYNNTENIFLGGLSMISNDVINFVKNDLRVFGISIFIFLVVALFIIFRQIRWILIPIVICLSSVVITAGILSLFGWKVTVISSNFISLQLIFTMAIVVHLTVKYREFYSVYLNQSQKELLVGSILTMIKPCFYTVATTVAGFSSLVFSGLLPVINFGWMMSIGIIVSLILSFLLFPLLQVNLNKVNPNFSFEKKFPIPIYFANFSIYVGRNIIWYALLIFIISIFGIFHLKVENSFIDYFKKNSEIYKGMKVIDENLGGTTLLDVTIDLNKEDIIVEAFNDNVDDDIDEFSEDEFDFLNEEVVEEDKSKLFFTSYKMNIINKVHDYLESYNEIGKVMSFSTLLKVGKKLNNGNDLDIIQLALLYSELPDKYKKIIINPYISIENNQARISMRIIDSLPDLRRNELINKLSKEIPKIAGIPKENIHLSNVLILYNNMLQSLFKSQILTLGSVIFLLFCMFLILFRSVSISLIAIFPNLISISFVLGFMGWFNIPLDLMTITIAAISMGIAVDNTIHYIYRFRNEVIKDNNYNDALNRTHRSIGFAMYYTSVTIIVGFSILIFSNFVPSIYFGLLTSMAMLIALLSSLILLPQLLILFKPFKY